MEWIVFWNNSNDLKNSKQFDIRASITYFRNLNKACRILHLGYNANCKVNNFKEN